MLRPCSFTAHLVLLGMLVCSARAQLAPPAPAPLTVEECVARALNQNFNLQLKQFSTQNARDQLISADASFDPALFASVAASGSRDERIATARSSDQQTSAALGVTQRLASGATATLSTSLDRSRETPYVAPPYYNPVYTNDLALSVKQPLLQGFGVTINRAAISRARIEISRTQLDFKDSVLTVIRNVEAAYYSLAFVREQLALRKLSLETTQRLLSENQTRQKTGVATSLDVLQAEVSVANARRDVLLAEQAVLNQEDTLISLIGRFEFAKRPGPLVLPDVPTTELSLDRSYALTLENSPNLAANQLFAEQLKLDLAVAKNNQQPSLDLGAAVGFNSADRSSASGAFASTADGDSSNWQVDLTLTIPWGLRAEKAAYRQARTNLSRQETALAQLDQNLLVAVRAAVRAIETNRENVVVTALAATLSQKQFEAEKARYEAGRSTYRFVEDARRDQDTARVNALQAAVNLRIAVAELAFLEGTSLARYQVKLEP